MSSGLCRGHLLPFAAHLDCHVMTTSEVWQSMISIVDLDCDVMTTTYSLAERDQHRGVRLLHASQLRSQISLGYVCHRCCQALGRAGPVQSCSALMLLAWGGTQGRGREWCTTRFRSAIKVLGKHMLLYHRHSSCGGPCSVMVS